MNEHGMQANERQSAVNLAEIFLQQSARMLEMQAAAARTVLRAQALYGVPNWPALCSDETERRFSELVHTTTDQAVKVLRQTNDSFAQMQKAINEVIENQTRQLTARLRSEFAALGQQLEQSADRALNTAEHGTRAVEQASAVLEEAAATAQQNTTVQQTAGGLQGAKPKRHASTK